MQQHELEQYIIDGKSTRDIANETGKSQTTIRYWLAKYNIKTEPKNLEIRPNNNTRICPSCKEEKTLDMFYQRRGQEGASVYCKICTNQESVNRQRLFKLKCIEYKGGKCQICKYDKHPGALEFHHINPNEKDFQISKVKNYTFNTAIEKELDKCALLCSNCHKEVHGGLIALSY